MTRNDPLNKLEWLIRPRSGVDSTQWDWGIMVTHRPETDLPNIFHI